MSQLPKKIPARLTLTKQQALEEIDRCNEQLLWHARNQMISRPEVVVLLEQRRQVAVETVDGEAG